MNQQDKEAIQEIEGKAGFRVIKNLAEQKIKNLESVRSIEPSGKYPIDAQALGKKYAVEVLEDFLYDLSILERPLKSNKNTYE